MRNGLLIALFVAVVGGAAFAAGRASINTFTDGSFGYSMNVPSFQNLPKNMSATRAHFYGPPKDGFRPNINIMVQRIETTRADYKKLSLGQFKDNKFKVNSVKEFLVSGRPALRIDYQGTISERDLRWLSLAVIEKGQVFLVTATALKDDYPRQEKEFSQALASFRRQ